MTVKLTKTVVLKLAEHDESLDKTLKAYSEKDLTSSPK